MIMITLPSIQILYLLRQHKWLSLRDIMTKRRTEPTGCFCHFSISLKGTKANERNSLNEIWGS